MLAGTVLPDLIDKPLYYALTFATGHHGAELGFLRGSRGFGHTWALAAAVWLVGTRWKSERLRALALGMATHPALDFISDVGTWGWASALRGNPALWPLTGWRFPVTSTTGLADHLGGEIQPFLLGAEVVGLFLLWYNSVTPKAARR